MAITLIQGNPIRTGAGSGSSTFALGYLSAVAAGNTLICTVSGDATGGATFTGVTDSLGQTWTKVDEIADANERVAIYRKENTAGGTPTVTITITIGTSSGGVQLTLFEIHSDVSTPVLNVSNKATAGTGVSDPGNLITTYANAFVIAATENAGGESTGGSSYTWLDSTNGSNFASCQYRIVSATATYSTAFGTNTASGWAAISASFGEASVPTATQLYWEIRNDDGSEVTAIAPGQGVVQGAVFRPRILVDTNGGAIGTKRFQIEYQGPNDPGWIPIPVKNNN